jgi:hypothetical protein
MRKCVPGRTVTLQATMDERARRLWAGTEAGAIGWGGVAAVGAVGARDQHGDQHGAQAANRTTRAT